MSRTDIIADSLTIIRNASMVKHEEALIPYSKALLGVMEILKDEGYIDNFKELDAEAIKRIKVYLKYENKKTVITKIKKISKPGRRIYVEKTNIPYVCNGYGVAVISTSKGILSGKKARSLGVGGEVICYIW